MKMLDALVRGGPKVAEERGWGFDPYVLSQPWASFVGSMPGQTDGTFDSYVRQIHKQNATVAAAVTARALLISQVRFQWRRDYTQNRRGELWGNRDLRILERPGVMTRAELLNRLERDVSYAGNAYVVRDGNSLRRLSPDRVSFVMRADSAPEWTGNDNTVTIPFDAEVVGIAYHNERHGTVTETFAVGDYAHWMPEPDPVNWWRGESWVSAVVREVVTDGQAVDHTSKFFENAATPNLVFKFPEGRTPEEVRAFADLVNRTHSGSNNAWRNMFLAGGADVQVVGSSLESLSIKDLTGGFETRIAERARIPGVILGISEGYQGSSLNAGNYGSARRMWADGWFAPTVESLCAALESIVPPPGGSELHYDPKAVLFLQEDMKDAADILHTNAVAMRQLVEAGYAPASVTEAVATGDITKLTHTGNVSVQLQPPGSQVQANSVDIVAELRAVQPAPTPIEVHNHVTERQVTVENRVEPTPVTIDNTVSVEPTPVTIDNRTDVHVPEQQRMDVAAPIVNVTNVVEPTPVTIDNNVTAHASAPTVNVQIPEHKSRHRVKRDKDGRIAEVLED